MSSVLNTHMPFSCPDCLINTAKYFHNICNVLLLINHLDVFQESREPHQVVHSATRASLGLGISWHPGTTLLQNLKADSLLFFPSGLRQDFPLPKPWLSSPLAQRGLVVHLEGWKARLLGVWTAQGMTVFLKTEMTEGHRAATCSVTPGVGGSIKTERKLTLWSMPSFVEERQRDRAFSPIWSFP